MSESTFKNQVNFWKPIILVGAVLFLYAQILARLAQNWWVDENYSHGLLVPFLIGFIIYLEFENLRKVVLKPQFVFGISLILFALSALFLGTLGAELFTQRISLVILLTGIIVYLFGFQLLKKLSVPFALLVLAIPIPAIIFNKIAFPLQMLATKFAVWGVRLFEVPIVRQGNVVEILPKGAMQFVQLEVVEACSGIRSLMTLMTLALVYAYFTSVRSVDSVSSVSSVEEVSETQQMQLTLSTLRTLLTPQTLRTLILMLSAIPIAVLTNGGRVTATILTTYTYGKETADGFLHTLSGWLVYLVALALMFFVGKILDLLFRISPKSEVQGPKSEVHSSQFTVHSSQFIILISLLVVGGLAINYFEFFGEVKVERQKLRELPAQLGNWKSLGNDTKFSPETESVLRADDYVMRDYAAPDGKTVNLYIGYYSSQKSGATYHSPLNCLPGAGWQMSAPALVEIKQADGRTFAANRYIVQNDKYRALMIYWYQGRGRTAANEFLDKTYTIYDSILLRRSDGAMIRVMTTVNGNETEALESAKDFASQISSPLSAFVPN